MSDNLNQVWGRFHGERVAPPTERFPGWYRALVVETNDPLQIHRIRFKCPELHDFTLKPEECPWACPAPALGGKNAGSWGSPMIGDIVWIAFEKNHFYGPIWCGTASGTRRKRYPLESIYTKSPMSVKEDGKSDDQPSDYLEDYLPKDKRPMSTGWRDRYGSSEVNSSVGFFPKEHDTPPALTGYDAVSKKDFEKGDKPKINEPDRKYMARTTKYGNFVIQSDVGYHWHKEDGEPLGEFLGDFDKDRDWEVKRYFYLTKLFNEGEPKDTDQRRYEIRTRAGHKLEMRDVGWAQKDGGLEKGETQQDCKNRKGEYDDEPRILSKWEKSDERWVKIRTKGGHLIQAMDMGFHPEKDNFYKRLLSEESGSAVDSEKGNWDQRDARQIRIITRWGSKFVLDDRGSHGREAESKEKPRANGWLLKTRRSWTIDETTPRGFGFEAIDKDILDTTRWYSPKSKIIEMNDYKDYMMFCTDMANEISRDWAYLDENEFAVDIAMTNDPEKDTYHLKLDKANGYLRLKTAAGGDNGRRPEPEQIANADSGLNQGLEARDGRYGTDGAWTELVDIDHRGIWFSRKNKLGIWRGAQNSDQFIVIDDGNQRIVIRNMVSGPIQISCLKDIEIIAERDVNIVAGRDISMKAGRKVVMNVGSASASLEPGNWFTNVPDNAPRHTGYLPGAMPGPGAQSNTGKSAQANNPSEINQDPREPKDRNKVGNGPFLTVSEEVITG